MPSNKTDWTPSGTDDADDSVYENRRQELEREALADEILAESYGQWMEFIWDRVKESDDKLGVLGVSSIDSIQFGEWSDPRMIEHDIILREIQEPSNSWTQEDWQSWLGQLKSQGIELDQMQWRHIGFDPQAESGPASTYTFEFHAKQMETGIRWILRGKMVLQWSSLDASRMGNIKNITINQATLLERKGLPPFEHVVAADVSPSEQELVLEPNLQVLDLNADSAPEIILSRINRVFWNQGNGRFRTGNLLEFPLDQFHQGITADFNGDTFLDYLAVTTQGLALYLGDGKGAFAQAPQKQNIFHEQLVNPFVLTAGDIDGDRDLDLWLGQYKVPYQDGQMPTPFYDANDGYPAFLLINNGHGEFKDVSRGSGLEKKRYRRTYSASFVDLDEDLDLDLVVVSDFSGVDFYQNDGTGHFEDMTPEWGGDHYGFGMAHLMGDWNLDEHMDLLMIGMHSSSAERLNSLGIHLPETEQASDMRTAMAYGNRVFWGNGRGVRQIEGVHPMRQTGWSWGTANIDFDLDGDQDVYIVNGHITGARTYDYESEFWREDLFLGDSNPNPDLANYFESKQHRYQQKGASYGGNELNRFFLNVDGKEWIEVAYLLGLAMTQDCRNVVAADFDGNGLPDLAVTTFELWPDERQVLHLFPNYHQTEHQWIGVELREKENWPPLMGAKLKIKSRNRTFVHPVITGNGYRSQSPYRVHFGLGQADSVDEVTINWPDGTKLMFPIDMVNRYHRIDLMTSQGE